MSDVSSLPGDTRQDSDTVSVSISDSDGLESSLANTDVFTPNTDTAFSTPVLEMTSELLITPTDFETGSYVFLYNNIISNESNGFGFDKMVVIQNLKLN